ncbi:MAG: type II toxin-antitoxin system VapC family toxin [Egibacteraceae bacterium]
MIVFLDTSAIYALLSKGDTNHDRAVGLWEQIASSSGGLVTQSYLVVEAATLVQRRLGMEAVQVLYDEILPTVAVVWVDERLHDLASSAFRQAPRNLSLVDLVSFEVMREYKIRNAFSFDSDFTAHGFTMVP